MRIFMMETKSMNTSQMSPYAKTIQVFKGKKMQCSKSIADKLAKELGLQNCHADEIILAQMREDGLCHYIGSYSGEFLDLWKSRDEHVFCCFGSKLAKILQENARKQLNLDWDIPKQPNCRGSILR